MSVGGQVSSNKQSGNQSSNTSYSTSGQSSDSGTSYRNVMPTVQFGQANDAITKMLMGGDYAGLTPQQQDAMDFMGFQMREQPINWQMQGVNSNLDKIGSGEIPGVSTSDVVSNGAFSAMAPYEGKYASMVLDPTLGAFDRAKAIDDNAVRASRDAGSAFGDRAAIADNERNAAYAAARGKLAGDISGQGYGLALGAGQGDVANALSASGQNASNKLAMTGANAANALTGRSQSLQAEAQKASNLQSIFQNGMQSAAAMLGGGGMSVDQMLRFMTGQTPAFNEEAGGSSQSSTSSEGTGSAVSVSSGKGSGKGGGASVPIF